MSERLRADLERETQLRRDAEAHVRSLQESLDAAPYPDDVERLLTVLRAVDEESTRDTWPHSSAWLITATAMNMVRRALGKL